MNLLPWFLDFRLPSGGEYLNLNSTLYSTNDSHKNGTKFSWSWINSCYFEVSVLFFWLMWKELVTDCPLVHYWRTSCNYCFYSPRILFHKLNYLFSSQVIKFWCFIINVLLKLWKMLILRSTTWRSIFFQPMLCDTDGSISRICWVSMGSLTFVSLESIVDGSLIHETSHHSISPDLLTCGNRLELYCSAPSEDTLCLNVIGTGLCLVSVCDGRAGSVPLYMLNFRNELDLNLELNLNKQTK